MRLEQGFLIEDAQRIMAEDLARRTAQMNGMLARLELLSSRDGQL